MFKKLSRKKIIFPIVSILILLAALSPCVCDNTPGSYLPVVITPDLQAPTGRPNTYSIAASDAPAHVIAQADYVCNGTDDEVEINAAIAAMAAHDAHQGGLIQLSAGQFNISSSITMNNAYTLISGECGSLYTGTATSSGGTVLYLVDNSDCDLITVTEEKCGLRYVSLYGNRTNQTGDWDGVDVTDPGYADFYMEHCYTWGFGAWGLTIDDYCVGTRLVNCTFETSGNAGANTGGGIQFNNSSGYSNPRIVNTSFFACENAIEMNGLTGATLTNISTLSTTFRSISILNSSGVIVSNWLDKGCNASGSLRLYKSDHCNIGLTAVESAGNIALISASQHNLVDINAIECGQNAGNNYAAYLFYTDGIASSYNTFKIYVGDKGSGSGIDSAVYCNNAGNDENKVLEGDFSGCVGTPVNIKSCKGWIFENNFGYIAPGEIRTISKAITAGAQNTVTAIQNPEAQDCVILEAFVSVTAAATATNPTYDMGTDDDGSGAPSDGNNLFDAIPDTAGYYRSTSNGLGGGASGVQTQPVVWNAAGGASDYVNFIIVDAAGADTAGEIYIQYMGLG